MLGSYVTGGGAAHRAVSGWSKSAFAGGRTPPAAAQVAIRWQFELLGGKRRVASLAQEAVEPVLEAIAADLDKADWQSVPRVEPMAAASAP